MTLADRNAETAMRTLIERRYPDHGIIGEEHGTKGRNEGDTFTFAYARTKRAVLTRARHKDDFVHGSRRHHYLNAELSGQWFDHLARSINCRVMFKRNHTGNN